jgi:hypothetical protein
MKWLSAKEKAPAVFGHQGLGHFLRKNPTDPLIPRSAEELVTNYLPT